jgi:membrane protease subunit HflC
MKRFPLPTIVTAVGLVAVLLLYFTTYVVRFNQKVIKLRFGRAEEASVERGPGLYFKWPPPIESTKAIDMRLQTLDSTESEVKTADGKNIIVSAAVIWRIADPLQFYRRVRDEERARNEIRNRLNAAQATVIGRMQMSEFVNLDAEAVERGHGRFEDDMLAAAAPRIRDDFGVELRSVEIRRISLPESVTQTVTQSMIEERKAKATQYREEGKAIAETIRSRAQSNADSILAFAQAKAKEIQSAGIQASTRILDQIAAEDREFFEWLRWLDALRAMLKQRTTIFIDQNSPIYRRFNEPLLESGSVPTEADGGLETSPKP